MNFRLGVIIGISAGAHALLLWLVTAPPRPPVLLLPYGNLAVDVSAGSGLFSGDNQGTSLNPAGPNSSGTPTVSFSPLPRSVVNSPAPSPAPPIKPAVPDAGSKGARTTFPSAPPPLLQPTPKVLHGQSEEGAPAPETHPGKEDHPVEPSMPAPAAKPAMEKIRPAKKAESPARSEKETGEKRFAQANPTDKVQLPATDRSLKPGDSQPVKAVPGSAEKKPVSGTSLLSGPSAGSGSPGGAPGGKGSSSGGTPGVPYGVRLLGNRMPAYPEEARLQGLEGRVVVWLRISAEGQVTEARVQESSGYQVLDDAALKWAQSLRFLPARAKGAAVATTVLLPVRFRLVDAG